MTARRSVDVKDVSVAKAASPADNLIHSELRTSFSLFALNVPTYSLPDVLFFFSKCMKHIDLCIDWLYNWSHNLGII